MDPRIRIRIHPKMSWIRNTDRNTEKKFDKFFSSSSLVGVVGSRWKKFDKCFSPSSFGPIDKNYRTFHPGSEKTHPGSRGQKGTGSRIRICNTVFIFNYRTRSSTAWLTVHHPICSFFSNKIFSLCDFKKRCTSTVSNKNRIDFLLFIISSMLLLSFLSTPRYERERKSAFY